jgi:hypothetical protein
MVSYIIVSTRLVVTNNPFSGQFQDGDAADLSSAVQTVRTLVFRALVRARLQRLLVLVRQADHVR